MRRGYRALTSGGPLAALILFVLNASVCVSSWRWWRGDGLWAVQEFGGSLYLAFPALLAVTAAVPILRGGAATDDALMPTVPWRARVRRNAVDTIIVAATHFSFVITALVASLAQGDRPPAPSLAVSLGVQFAVIVFVCVAGRATGELIRHPIAVAVAAGIGVLLLAFADNVLPLSAGSSPYVGLVLDRGPYLASITVLAAAAAGLLLRPPGRRGVIAGVTVLLAVLVASQQIPQASLRPSGADPRACSQVESIEVCLFQGYRRHLPALADVTAISMRALREQGIDTHLKVLWQSAPGTIDPVDHVPFSFTTDILESGRINAQMVRGRLLYPTWCPALSAAGGLPAWFETASQQIYHWLEHAEGTIDDREYRRRVPRFARLSPGEQKAAVQRYFDKTHSCEGLG